MMKQMSRCQVSYFHTDGWRSYRRILPQIRHSVNKGGTLQSACLPFGFRVNSGFDVGLNLEAARDRLVVIHNATILDLRSDL